MVIWSNMAIYGHMSCNKETSTESVQGVANSKQGLKIWETTKILDMDERPAIEYL